MTSAHARRPPPPSVSSKACSVEELPPSSGPHSVPCPVDGPLTSLLSLGTRKSKAQPSWVLPLMALAQSRAVVICSHTSVAKLCLSSLSLSLQCQCLTQVLSPLEHRAASSWSPSFPLPIGPVFWPRVLLLKAHIWPCHFSAETSSLVVVAHSADASPSTQGTLQLAGTPYTCIPLMHLFIQEIY